jgi:thioredoxin reductase (NADPH)
MTEKLYDVVIIGGGPAGLSAAQYAARANLKTIVLDKSPTAGALAFANKIENYPGLIKPLSGKELLSIFREQAKKFGAEYVETQVTGAKLKDEIKEVYTVDKTYKGKTVIIATGAMGRKPSIKGERRFLGKGVSYCAVCDAAFFKDRTVCVIGNSEEAVKEAELLKKFAKTIYLIAPLKEFHISKGLVSKGLKLITGHRIVAIDGGDVVTKVRIQDIETGKERDIPTDGVFIYLHGNKPIVDFLNFSVDLSDEECIITNKMMETSIPGVFAAGDVTCVGVRQVVVAAAYGCIAALSAEKYIHHRKRRRYDWSKSNVS